MADSMSESRLWSRNTSLPSTSDEVSLGRETKWADLENLSITERMTVLLYDSGKLEKKSRAMCDHGWRGTSKGHRRPGLGLLDPLFCAQTGHAATNFLVSCSIEGHQDRIRVTGKFCCVCPLQDTGLLGFWDKQSLGWAFAFIQC